MTTAGPWRRVSRGGTGWTREVPGGRGVVKPHRMAHRALVIESGVGKWIVLGDFDTVDEARAAVDQLAQ